MGMNGHFSYEDLTLCDHGRIFLSKSRQSEWSGVDGPIPLRTCAT